MEPPAVSDYAIVGDCHTAALVSRGGSVDWLCWPTFASPSWFARLLDPDRGGHFAVRPAGPFESERRYVPHTNVLRTTFRTARGTVRVEDAMPVAPRARTQGELRPDRELSKIVECEEGEVTLEVELVPRPDYARARPTIRRRGELGIFCTHGSDAMVFRCRPDALRVDREGARVHGTLRLREGERAELALAFACGEPAIAPLLGEPARDRSRQTAAWWRSWWRAGRYSGPYRDAVERSLLTLRLLLYAPSGGVVAAPTASLPETIGGSRNWDYRFCWLRDAALTVEILEELGYADEARAFVSWVLHSTRLTFPRLRSLYDLWGRHRPTKERSLPHLRGHRGSRPVRVGNDASEQLQLDSYGELMCAAATYYLRRDEAPDRSARRLLRGLGLWVCEHWDRPDAGIWEIRSRPRHHTFSQAMCWTTLDALLQLHDRFDLNIPVERVQRDAAAIRETIERRGWSERHGSYQGSFEEDRADASLLLLGRYGYADPRSPRMRGTVARVRRELERDGMVLRYPPGTDDGLSGAEGAFGACSFWLVGALARQGDLPEARRTFEGLLARANDVGLYAEEMALPDGAPLGNFPQALTHLALVDAALELHRAAARYPASGAEAA
jgi:GH15 family glucan-1,4-alpha-glucosidase